MPALRRERWWLLFNLVALGTFLVFAAQTWLEPELKGVSGPNGGAGVVWVVTALPILFVALIADLIWLVRAVAHGITTKDRQPIWLALGCAAIWVLVVAYDQFRH